MKILHVCPKTPHLPEPYEGDSLSLARISPATAASQPEYQGESQLLQLIGSGGHSVVTPSNSASFASASAFVRRTIPSL